MDADPLLGLAPVDVGDREIFDPETYPGTDDGKVQLAIWDAEQVAGAVVMSRVYETTRSLYIKAPILVTGGGLRRACTPVATLVEAAEVGDSCFALAEPAPFAPGDYLLAVIGPSYDEHLADLVVSTNDGSTICMHGSISASLPAGASFVRHNNLLTVKAPTDGVVIDSVLFDGANRCNHYTHDWRYNNALPFRGDNVVRNSLFFDSPSETITPCGATVENNRAFRLQGSFLHKSCPTDPEPLDVVFGNYVDGANLAGDEVMQHSEGLITHSANAGTVDAFENVFRNGGEGVFGLASLDDTGIHASGDCYANFSHVIELYDGASQKDFVFDVELINVPVVYK